jgi:uncharacterized membrane protein
MMLALLSLMIFLILAVLFPFVFGELMITSLSKLHLSPSMALTLVIAIFVGGLINIPVKSIVSDRNVAVHPLAVYGLAGFWPQLQRVRHKTIIAVNLGGCVIPVVLVFYEIIQLAAFSPHALLAVAAGCSVNILVCYFIARPVAGIGIVMPGLVSSIAAAGIALFFVPDVAAPVAFIIGVVGPLVGADLMHLKDIEDSEIGVVSIGGAGTFDGIVLSGVVAAYLA